MPNTIDHNNISYQEIYTFLKAAENLNISATAKELHITQPAVSKRIAMLEKKLGLLLLIRSSYGIALTPAGKIFYEEMAAAQRHIDAAVIKAKEMQINPVRLMKLCYDGFFDLPLLYSVIQKFNESTHSGVIETYPSDGKENCDDLVTKRADLQICPTCYMDTAPDQLTNYEFTAFQFSILVSKENPLSKQERLSVSDLKGIALTVARNDENSPYLQEIRKIFSQNGIRPNFEHFVSRESLCFEIVSKKSIGIASPGFWAQKNERTAGFFSENIKVYPIEGAYYPISLVWRKDDKDKNIRQFVKCFKDMLQKPDNHQMVQNCYM